MAIYNKYASKKRVILNKNKKNSSKIGGLIKRNLLMKSHLISDECWKKAILEQIHEITKNVKQIKDKIAKIEK